MPEVRWVPLGYLLSVPPGTGSLATKVLTLDAIEAWLRAEDEASQLNGERGYVSAKDLLTQVTAMKEGRT